ncbi:DUF4129 domain-containing protein [Roseivirga pacifica]|uniref:DUF4129 domain-containing protein n=1 Tax=Roseivirga pacifica TaxID=1267423 RepID=UPI003BABEBCD
MRFTKCLLLSFFLITATGLLQGQDVIRSFDESQLNELRQDSNYQYELVKPEPENFISRLWNRITNWFYSLFSNGTTGDVLEILFYVLLATAFIYFLIKVFGVEVSTIFKPAKKPTTLDYQVDEEAIHEIDFDKEIKTALQAGNYRFAIRLIYLLSLKRASDAGLVNLMQGKTNREYLYELSGKPIEAEFTELSYLFDYTWYGHFEANEKLANKAEEHLNAMFKEGGKP